MLYLEIVNKQCILTSKGRLEPKNFDGCTEQEAVYNSRISKYPHDKTISVAIDPFMQIKISDVDDATE